MKIEIVTANPDQLYLINQIAYQTWPDAYRQILSNEQMQYMLESFYNTSTLFERMQKNSLFFIAFDNGQALGFAEIGLNERDQLTKLHKLYVLPQAQGRNLGQMLLLHCIEMAKRNNQNGIFLNVNRYNKAKLFYEKQGFSVTKEEDIDIGKGYYMNDYVMQLNFE